MSATKKHSPLTKRDLEQLARWTESALRTERPTNFATMLHTAQRS